MRAEVLVVASLHSRAKSHTFAKRTWPHYRQQGETDDMDLFKDPAMLKRLNDLNSLSDPDIDGILYALDGLLRNAKARKAYGH